MLEFKKIVENAIEKQAKSPIHINLRDDYPILVIGDIHGYYDVVERFEEILDEYGIKIAVLLGDYVDRGYEGLEVLEEILRLYNEEPNKIFILRGNHESIEMNQYYGFYDEILSKLGKESINYLRQIYSSLSISVNNDKIFFVHGGIPCIDCKNKSLSLKIDYLNSLKNIKLSNEYLNLENKIIFQMLWNDPDGYVKWFENNNVRGEGVYYYGRYAWNKFLKENNLKLIIRGHEVVDGVHIWKADGTYINKVPNNKEFYYDTTEGSVITVFSSRYHVGRSGSLILYKDSIKFIEL